MRMCRRLVRAVTCISHLGAAKINIGRCRQSNAVRAAEAIALVAAGKVQGVTTACRPLVTSGAVGNAQKACPVQSLAQVGEAVAGIQVVAPDRQHDANAVVAGHGQAE
jgi:hypothetical protein